MGTKIGAKIAHLAEPEDTKMLTKEQRRIKATHRGIPVKPTFSRKSAPPMANSVPNLVQLKKTLELSAEEAEQDVGAHTGHLFGHCFVDVVDVFKAAGNISIGKSADGKQNEQDRDQSLKERRAYKFSVFTGQRSHKEQYGDQGHINESCDSCRMKALFLLGRNFIQLGVSGALVFSKTRLDHMYRAPSNDKGAEEGGCDHEEPVTGCVYGKGGFWHERLDGIIGKALEQCVGSCYHQVRGKTGLGACVANHHTHNGVLAHAHVYNGGHGRDHHHGSVGSDVADGSDERYHIGNQGSRNVL